MDQDFHYYSTFCAARVAGVEPDEAARIARASNFIDFLHEGDYGGRWHLVDTDGRTELGVVEHPRFTFQSGKLSTGVAPEDGLWCSFHFTPGNYDHIAAPTSQSVHGRAVVEHLPPFVMRDVDGAIDRHAAPLLNRPQSALSRELIAETIRCLTEPERLTAILEHAVAGPELLERHGSEVIERFGQLLLGVRSHVIADTWAHQDFSGIDHEINTYYDVADELGRQAIEYDDGAGSGWQHTVLSCLKHENLQAVPNGTSYLGHGWMGHFPDFSFARFRYKPRWRARSLPPIERDNPGQYRHAFLELVSMFAQARGDRLDPSLIEQEIAAAGRAIDAPCEVASRQVCPRHESSLAWQREFAPFVGEMPSDQVIDARREPDDAARLSGLLASPGLPLSMTPWGSYTVEANSDLYLFQIAADYHFHFVKHWLAKHDLREFTGSWSQRLGPLDPSVLALA